MSQSTSPSDTNPEQTTISLTNDAISTAISVAKKAAQYADSQANRAVQSVHLAIQKKNSISLLNEVVEHLCKQDLRRKGIQLLRQAYLES